MGACAGVQGAASLPGAPRGAQAEGVVTMSEPSGVDLAARPAAARPLWEPPDRRRVLQLVLASFWLLDAVLQLQPFMFSRAFGLSMLGPTAVGNPSVIAHPIIDVSRSIGHHSVGADTAFVVVQLLLAFGIAYRPTVRLGLAASVVWALVVWWLGEGLGGVLAGSADPLTGAPGAVILYAALAVLLWPTDRGATAPFVAAGPVGATVARGVWVTVWGSLAGLALVGYPARRTATLLSALSIGEPAWLADLDRHVAHLATGHGLLIAIVACVVLAGVALGVFLPAGPARAVILVAVAVSLGTWVLGEDLGMLLSGSATDPNTGPLLVLLAAAYWPLRRVAPELTHPGPVR